MSINIIEDIGRVSRFDDKRIKPDDKRKVI